MLPRMSPQLLGAALAVAALVACGGGLVPGSSSPGASSDSASSSRAEVQAEFLSHLDPDTASRLAPRLSAAAVNPLACESIVSKIPGTYAELIALGGTVTGTTFTSGSNSLALWTIAKFVRATPTPVPTPGKTPTPKPTSSTIPTAPPGQPLYFYFGTYQLKKYGQGCAFLIASVDGKIIKKQKSNAYAVDFPNFKGLTKPVKPFSFGALKMTVNLNPNGGKGSVVLLNPKGGANVDTGTMTLTQRIEVKP
jgi:hypothetical protein